VVPQKFRKLLRTLLIIAALAVVALLSFTTARPPPRPPLPIPNGYDDLLTAGRAVADYPSNFSTLDHENLRAWVTNNSESLRLLRLGLSRRCAFPTETAMTNIMMDFYSFTALARVLEAEGRLAELENRPADAASSYVDAIQLGNEISRGGLIMNRLVGISCAAVGSRCLAKLVPGLSCEQVPPLIARLEKIDKQGVTWSEVRQNENAFQSVSPIKWVTGWLFSRVPRQKAQTRHNIAVAHIRLLMTELSLRCYQAETGRAPTLLEQLVPRYLQSVPLDPFSGQPLVYHSLGTNWLLYSLGTDRVDDGGKPVGTGPESKGDMFFDSPW
jgi:hypothetical protein